MKDKEPKLKRRPGRDPRPQLLQLMPGRRVRLDPTIVRAVATWLIAHSAPWQREANASERGLTGAERDSFCARRQYYRHALKVIGDIICGLSSTLPLDAIDSAHDEVAWALSMHESEDVTRQTMMDASPVVPGEPQGGE